MSKTTECPQCSGPLKVWIDIDATVSFNVTGAGKLIGRSIDDTLQSDGRCGLDCQNCDWKVHGEDVEDPGLMRIIEAANEKWSHLQLSAVKAKS